MLKLPSCRALTEISYTGRNCDLPDDFLPFTSQDCLEYFGILYNDSVSDLFSYHHGEPRPYHEEHDSNNNLVIDSASSPSSVIQQEKISDYPVENAFSNSSSSSSSESSRDTSETTLPTKPSSSATPEDAEQSQVVVKPSGGSPPSRTNTFTCPQCHKVFPKMSVLR